jgi:hypothetical protein
MRYKRLLFWLLCAASITVVSGQNIGVPIFLWVGTYGTDTYVGSSPNTTNAEALNRSFFDNLSAKVSASSYASYLAAYRYILRERTTDTYANYANDPLDNCEMVVVSGHGSPGFINFYDGSANIACRKLGNYNKWMFSYEGNVLKPFGSTYNFEQAQMFRPVFNGLHGIFGFSSIVYGYTSYACGFLWLSTCYRTPLGLWDEFFQRWVINKETMWSAWVNATYNKLYVSMKMSGIEAAAVGVQITVNGTTISGIDEKIDQTYRSAMPPAGANGVMLSRWYKAGSPNY